MKRAIILGGVSGTGKTHAWLNAPELKDLPYLDIADAYREFPEFQWDEAFCTLAKCVRATLEEHDTVVIEGYFLPGSTTGQWLLNDLQVAGAKAETRWFWAPFEICQERIVAQFEQGETATPDYRRRIELLKRCWRPQPSARG